MAKIGIFGAGWVGLVTGACFADLGHDVVIRDVVPEKIDSLRAARCRSTRPTCRSCSSATASGSRSRSTRTASPAAEFLFVCVDTPPTYSGDADLSRVWTRRRGAARARGPADPRDEVDGAGRDRARRCAQGSTRAASAHVGYVSNPEFLSEGNAVHEFMHPDRVVVGELRAGGRRRGGGALRGARRADRPLRRQLGGDDQAGRERVPDDAHLVHQRDRERVRGDGRRRRQGRRGRRARPPARPALPARGDRLRRLVLPEGLARAEAARVELGLPLPAALGRDRGQRAPEAARDREAEEAPRLAARARRSRCSGSRSSRTPTTCARRRRSSSRAGCSPRAPRCAAGIRSPTATALPRGVEIVGSVLDAVRGADAAVIVTEWAELRDLARDEVRAAMANPLIIDGRNLLDPAATARGRLRLRGHRARRPRRRTSSPRRPSRVELEAELNR